MGEHTRLQHVAGVRGGCGASVPGGVGAGGRALILAAITALGCHHSVQVQLPVHLCHLSITAERQEQCSAAAAAAAVVIAGLASLDIASVTAAAHT